MQYSLCFAFNAVGLTTGSAAIVKMRGMVRATTLSVNGLLITSLTAVLSLWLAGSFLQGGIVAPLTGLGNLIVSTAGVILSCTLVRFILWLLLPLTNRRPQASAVHAERS